MPGQRMLKRRGTLAGVEASLPSPVNEWILAGGGLLT